MRHDQRGCDNPSRCDCPRCFAEEVRDDQERVALDLARARGRRLGVLRDRLLDLLGCSPAELRELLVEVLAEPREWR